MVSGEFVIERTGHLLLGILSYNVLSRRDVERFEFFSLNIIMNMRPGVLFTATCSLFISCCPSGSPFDLNDTDRATVQMIAEFEHYQVLAVEIAGTHQGPAAVIVKSYDWNHDKILLDLQHIADNNALDLPTSLNAHYKEELEELRESSPEAFDDLYLYHASEELKKIVSDLRIEARGGAEFSVLALNAKMLSLIGRQLNAVDSVLYGK